MMRPARAEVQGRRSRIDLLDCLILESDPDVA